MLLFCASFNSLLGYNLISGSWDHQKWVFADVDNHHIWQNSFCDNHDVWQKSSQLCRVMVLAQEGSEPNQEEPLLRQLTNQFLMRASQAPAATPGQSMTLQIDGCLAAGARQMWSSDWKLSNQFLTRPIAPGYIGSGQIRPQIVPKFSFKKFSRYRPLLTRALAFNLFEADFLMRCSGQGVNGPT